MYTNEMTTLLGEVYYDLLVLLNNAKHDPFEQTSSVFPAKCLIMLLKKVRHMRPIPAETEEKISRLMAMIDPEDMDKLMNTPCPMEKRMCFEYGKMKHYQSKK